MCGKVGPSVIETLECIHMGSLTNGSGGTSTGGSTTINMSVDHLLPESSTTSFFVGRGNKTVKRLQTWGRMPPQERSLVVVFEIMKRALENSGIPQNVLADAKFMYHCVYTAAACVNVPNKRNVLSRGDIRSGLIAYIVWAACQKNSIIVSNAFICDLFGVTERTFRNGKKKYFTAIIKRGVTDQCDYGNTTVLTYVHKLLNYLKLDERDQLLCIIMAKRIEQIQLICNKQTISIAAGIIFYIVHTYYHGEKYAEITRTMVATLSNKSETTIVKIVKIIETNAKYLIPLGW